MKKLKIKIQKKYINCFFKLYFEFPLFSKTQIRNQDSIKIIKFFLKKEKKSFLFLIFSHSQHNNYLTLFITIHNNSSYSITILKFYITSSINWIRITMTSISITYININNIFTYSMCILNFSVAYSINFNFMTISIFIV